MAMQQCPDCSNDLPAELGVHASSSIAGSVQCPHCGSTVILEKPKVEVMEAGAQEADEFAGGAFERARQSLQELNPEATAGGPLPTAAGLEEARAKMEEAASEPGVVPGTGVQEEETARIADHLAFPGTGIDDLRREDEPLEETLERLGANEVDRAREGSLEQAARLGQEPGGQR